MDKPQKIKCPFCAEEILAGSMKCKHCGEWLITQEPWMDTEDENKVSLDSRAVTKGIERAEFNKTAKGCLGIIAMIPAVFVSIYAGFFTHSATVGFIVFITVWVAIIWWIFPKLGIE